MFYKSTSKLITSPLSISLVITIIIIGLNLVIYPLVVEPIFAQSTQSENSGTQNSTNQQILGDILYSESTQSTGMRVIEVNLHPTVEISYTGNSSIGNTPTQTIGTVVSTMNDNGTVYSNGKAIITSQTGVVITYTSTSKGQYNPDGSFSDSGIMIFNMPFQSSSTNLQSSTSNLTQSNDLSDFDGIVGIYEKTVDRFGIGETNVWEWK